MNSRPIEPEALTGNRITLALPGYPIACLVVAFDEDLDKRRVSIDSRVINDVLFGRIVDLLADQ